MKNRFNSFPGNLAAIACLVLCSDAHALQWDGNAGTAGVSDAASAWNTANNWWNGSTNVSWAQNDDAQFGTGTLGGAGVASDGTWNPKPPETIAESDGKFQIDVPAASAALLVIGRGDAGRNPITANPQD